MFLLEIIPLASIFVGKIRIFSPLFGVVDPPNNGIQGV